MASLLEIVLNSGKRGAIIEDACRVLDAEVDSKSGLGGIAIKAAYRVVKGVSPSFIPHAVDDLLDEFLKALDPIYQEALGKNLKPRAYLEANRSRAAEALLAITDARAVKAKHALVKKTYDKLRPAAKQHVEAAVPRLGQMMATYLPG
jgi:hypothetical protein